MNNLMVTRSSELTMSSREIAEYTGKQHQHVKRDIEKMLSELDLDVSTFGRIYLDSMNRKQTEYMLDRDQTDCLLTGYSAKARMAVIKRWKQLENNIAPQLPQTFAQALQLAADQAAQLELQAPKVAFVDRYVEAGGNKTFRQVAKLLKANERQFRSWMVANRIQYILSGTWMAYQNHIDANRFSVSTGEKNGHAYTDCKFTPKGIEWISHLWANK